MASKAPTLTTPATERLFRSRPVPTAREDIPSETPPIFALPDQGQRDREVVILVLARWRTSSVAWGLTQLAAGALRRESFPGLRWRKILGSGHQGGFGLRPGWDRLAQLCVFADVDQARHWLAEDAGLAAWKRRAEAFCWLELQAWSSRGLWSGQPIAVTLPAAQPGPVAALTRASIRPGKARAFWSHSPPSEDALAQAPGCQLAIGLGEAPLLRQATFSVWDSVAAMEGYARSGAHLEAIRHAYRDQYFSESMFVRFSLTDQGGDWRAWRAH
ncbi:MAG: spirilloxanthin and/or spheroidene monooxygenase CrtA [Pseudomonadota bacterium]